MRCTRKLHTTLHGPTTAHTARTHTARCLRGLGATEEVVDDATLAVSELAANAHEHATGPIWLHIWEALGWAFIHVNDSAPHLRITTPPPPAPALTLEELDALEGDLTSDQHLASLLRTCERHRGLGIVTALFGSHWGVTYGRQCKAVWFALRLHPSAPNTPLALPAAPILAPPPTSHQEPRPCPPPTTICPMT